MVKKPSNACAVDGPSETGDKASADVDLASPTRSGAPAQGVAAPVDEVQQALQDEVIQERSSEPGMAQADQVSARMLPAAFEH